MAKNGAVYTKKVIAQLFDLSEKRIRQLTQEGIIEEFSTGYYKLVPTIQGYIGYLRSQIADDDEASDYNVEKAKLTRAKRENVELDLKVKKNELHKASDVEFIMGNMLVAFKSKMLTMPYKVLPELLNITDNVDKNEAIIKILDDAVREALNELSEYNPEDYNEEKYLSGLDDTVAEPIEDTQEESD